eukprot:5500353-Prymnesium_polylepis.1
MSSASQVGLKSAFRPKGRWPPPNVILDGSPLSARGSAEASSTTASTGWLAVTNALALRWRRCRRSVLAASMQRTTAASFTRTTGRRVQRPCAACCSRRERMQHGCSRCTRSCAARHLQRVVARRPAGTPRHRRRHPLQRLVAARRDHHVRLAAAVRGAPRLLPSRLASVRAARTRTRPDSPYAAAPPSEASRVHVDIRQRTLQLCDHRACLRSPVPNARSRREPRRVGRRTQ